MRIVVLGGGFGGVATVRHLERVLRRRTDVEITLVSRENFFVLTPNARTPQRTRRTDAGV
jgi:NADH:ubiquinone reductase (H+-translocating)